MLDLDLKNKIDQISMIDKKTKGLLINYAIRKTFIKEKEYYTEKAKHHNREMQRYRELKQILKEK